MKIAVVSTTIDDNLTTTHANNDEPAYALSPLTAYSVPETLGETGLFFPSASSGKGIGNLGEVT